MNWSPVKGEIVTLGCTHTCMYIYMYIYVCISFIIVCLPPMEDAVAPTVGHLCMPTSDVQCIDIAICKANVK